MSETARSMISCSSDAYNYQTKENKLNGNYCLIYSCFFSSTNVLTCFELITEKGTDKLLTNYLTGLKVLAMLERYYIF